MPSTVKPLCNSVMALKHDAPAHDHPPRALFEAARLYPTWDSDRLYRWIAARQFAAKCKPAFGKLLPLTQEPVDASILQFAARTTREAGFK